MAERQSLKADLIDGAIAGVVATWVMGKVTSTLYDHEDRQAREREDDARGLAGHPCLRRRRRHGTPCTAAGRMSAVLTTSDRSYVAGPVAAGDMIR